MTYRTITRLSQVLCLAGALTAIAQATTLASCNVNITKCAIQENILLTYPGGNLGIAGDVVVQEADHVTVSDVFRIFNDFEDTGGGTGLGFTMFLFSADDSTPLPLPATYSANVRFIQEGANGVTIFTSNGTTYILGAPEPATFGILSGVLGLGALLTRKRRGRKLPTS